MSNQTGRIALPGSLRRSVPGANLIGRSDTSALIKVSIFTRRNPAPPPELLAKANAISSQAIASREYLTLEEFAKVYGAAADDLDAVEKFAISSKFKIADSSAVKRRVLVEGTVGDIETTFGVELNEYERSALGSFRGRTGEIFLPGDLFNIITAVEGLDTRPAGKPRLVRSRFAGLPAKTTKGKSWPNKWRGTFFPPEIATLYDYPTEFDGTGENLAIFAFNGGNSPDPHGGYKLPALKTYFEHVLKGKTPMIQDVVVQGPGNDPGPDTPFSGNNGDTTGEVMLDLCVVGSVAPGAKLFVYFTEFTNQGWVEALHAAITDKNAVSVISISYGNPEDDPNGAWTLAGVKLVDEAMEAAGSRGITVCCASGDDGSRDDATSGAHADFPASSPWVLGVGGTSLKETAGSTRSIASETVWNDLSLPNPMGAGGGGVSSIFPLPAYQHNAGVPPAANPPHTIGRGVPDVAAVADPITGLVIMRIDGKTLEPIGGTSAAAPLWASLLIRLNQGLGSRIGFLNPTLYASCTTGVLNDITKGNNGSYLAGPGWDACTGFGSPDGVKLLHALKTAPAPQA